MRCPDCGKITNPGISLDALLGVHDGVHLKIQARGAVSIRGKDGSLFQLSDLNQAELAWCPECTAEAPLAEFVDSDD